MYAFGDYEDFDCANPPPPMTPYRCKTLSKAQWSALLAFSAFSNVTLLFGPPAMEA